jgi:hypothetical protein
LEKDEGLLGFWGLEFKERKQRKNSKEALQNEENPTKRFVNIEFP